MASKTLWARRITLVVLAAAAAGCGTAASGAKSLGPVGYRTAGRTVGFSQAATPRSQARRTMRTGRGYRAEFVAAVAGSIRSGPQGLAVFSSSDGRLLRWLVRRAPDPVPVSVSPNGRWLYYYDQGALIRGGCLRWHRGQAGQLFRLSAEQSGGDASIAVNRTGNAVLLEGGSHYPEIWRWGRGKLRLILRSTPSRVVWQPLWLSA
jgi:hypothetical protein